MLTYEPMRRTERVDCVKLETSAFANYEYFSIFVQNEKKRLRFLNSLFFTEIRVNEGAAIFITAKEGEQIVATSMLCAPDYRRPTEIQYLKAGFWKVLLHGGYKNVDKWYNIEQKAILPCQSLGGKTWLLNLLAVDPAKEGLGIGSRMIQEGLIPYVKKHGGETLCLFTNTQINRRFYEKNGFEEFDRQEYICDGKTLHSWSYRMVL